MGTHIHMWVPMQEGSLELESQATVNCQTWMLGTEFMFSAKAASVLNL